MPEIQHCGTYMEALYNAVVILILLFVLDIRFLLSDIDEIKIDILS